MRIDEKQKFAHAKKKPRRAPGLFTTHAQRGGVCVRREVTGRHRTGGVRHALSRNGDIHVKVFLQGQLVPAEGRGIEISGAGTIERP